MLFFRTKPLAQLQEKRNRRDVVGDGDETEEIVLKWQFVHRGISFTKAFFPIICSPNRCKPDSFEIGNISQSFITKSLISISFVSKSFVSNLNFLHASLTL